MNNDRFHNKNGSLTMYAFACGYIEKFALPSRGYTKGIDCEGGDTREHFQKCEMFETSLSAANTSISLWDIKGWVGTLMEANHFWIQATGLKAARRLYSLSRRLLKQVYAGKLKPEDYVEKMKEAEHNEEVAYCETH